jgi:hypothetical protein
LNTYGYVYQNPLRFADPTGEGIYTAAFCEAFVITQTITGLISTVDDVAGGEELILQQLDRVKSEQEKCDTSTAEGTKRYLELELIRKDLNRGLLSGLDGSVSRAKDNASLGVVARGLAASAVCLALLKATPW